jgi:hydrogenase maturation protease
MHFSNNDGCMPLLLPMKLEIVVIGIGQRLRGDDAAGLDAVKKWRSKYPQTARKVRFELAEVPGIGLLNLLIGARAVILVDAVMSGKCPGTIHHFSEDQVQAFTEGSRSAHGWGIAETLVMGRNLYAHSMPEKILVLGIELEKVEMGSDLSQPVKEALPDLVNTIEEQVKLMLHGFLKVRI